MTTPHTQVSSTRATQGHRYHWHGLNVLAMESGESVRVREIQSLPAGFDWLGPAHDAVSADGLIPQPMSYFWGDVPR